jgi:hypothetical protein
MKNANVIGKSVKIVCLTKADDLFMHCTKKKSGRFPRISGRKFPGGENFPVNQ